MGTPLIPLADEQCDIVAKLEFCNPTGSSKDRSALWILEQAIGRGEIAQDTTVVESSSGNFALALAFYCRMLGISFVPVIDPNCNEATESQLRLLCERVEKVAVRDGTGSYLKSRLSRVQELLVELDSAYWPNQYANPDARDAHYRFTAGELIAQAARSTISSSVWARAARSPGSPTGSRKRTRAVWSWLSTPKAR